MKRPRFICSHCLRSVAQHPNGRLNKHKAQGAYCRGSGEEPVFKIDWEHRLGNALRAKHDRD